tara:strand:+ start:515 stop:1141 length:627 start_codon:yes stop_codon:yes gene_type:complete
MPAPHLEAAEKSAAAKEAKKLHKDMRLRGERYQDFVCYHLYHSKGVVFQNFSSKAFQISHGENIQSWEIKLDSTHKKYKRLYIEISESAKGDPSNHSPSGIYMPSEMYFIGDWLDVYGFKTQWLRDAHRQHEAAKKAHKKDATVELLSWTTDQKTGGGTSKAFTVSLDMAAKHAGHYSLPGEPNWIAMEDDESRITQAKQMFAGVMAG